MMKLQYNDLDQITSNRLKNIFHANGFKSFSNGVIMHNKFAEIGQLILDLPIRKDDVFLSSYPRTGKIKSLVVVKSNVVKIY